MGVALFAGKTFRVDPINVQGSFRVKTRTTNTVGGRVIQVYGTAWDNLTVEGTFGVGGYPEQSAFLKRMLALFDQQVTDPAASPSSFVWPDHGWNFKVYLISYDNPDGRTIERAPEIIAPKWSLTLMVVEDVGGLLQNVKNDFIKRIGTGLGWKQTEYNGPLQDVTGLFQLPGQVPENTNTSVNLGGGRKVQ